MNITDFLRRHGKVINNVGVVLVVLLAVYVKMNDESGKVLFSINDVYIIVGFFLAFGFLIMLKKHRKE